MMPPPQWNDATHPVFPPGITMVSVGLFLGHGLITIVAW